MLEQAGTEYISQTVLKYVFQRITSMGKLASKVNTFFTKFSLHLTFKQTFRKVFIALNELGEFQFS